VATGYDLAVDGVSLDVRAGECHALVGENGAGKSTLGRIIAGIYRPDRPHGGVVKLAGENVRFRSPADASVRGIAMVHQELASCPHLSVAENLCLGRYPRRRIGSLDWNAMARRAAGLLHEVGVNVGEIDVDRPMGSLSTGQKQRVQIAHALGAGARLMVFDEPTSSLSDADSQALFTLIDTLTRRNVAVVYVSHRMPEIFRLADRVTVLRDGVAVKTLDAISTDESDLVRLMIGRELERYFPEQLPEPLDDVLLRVLELASPGRFTGVSFDVRAGEIVGLAGLVGAGRSELAQAIFGLGDQVSGRVEVRGEVFERGDVRQAMDRGVALVPEDRQGQGLIPGMDGVTNVSLASLDRMRRGRVFFDRIRARRVATDLFKQLDVRAESVDAPVRTLSGGNQQKVVLARWLARHAHVLMVDEPTRGVDVGAKASIHALLGELARQGKGVLLISSELPELLNLSSRVLVMRRGRIVAEFSRDEVTQEGVLRAMAGLAG